MTTPWALRLARSEARAAAALRTEPGILVHEADDAVWLKGSALDDRLDLRLRALPGAERFTVDNDNALTPAGRRLPSGTLPAGDWRPLHEWLSIAFPVAALPGETDERILVRLIRSPQAKPATILVTDLGMFRDYAATAPLIRLQRLTFAASDDGRALIRGKPLPPLPGERFFEDSGIAVPAGWTWTPAVEATVLADLLELHEHDIALLFPDGTWEYVPATEFVAVSRSALRLTDREVCDDQRA